MHRTCRTRSEEMGSFLFHGNCLTKNLTPTQKCLLPSRWLQRCSFWVSWPSGPLRAEHFLQHRSQGWGLHSSEWQGVRVCTHMCSACVEWPLLWEHTCVPSDVCKDFCPLIRAGTFVSSCECAALVQLRVLVWGCACCCGQLCLGWCCCVQCGCASAGVCQECAVSADGEPGVGCNDHCGSLPTQEIPWALVCVLVSVGIHTPIVWAAQQQCAPAVQAVCTKKSAHRAMCAHRCICSCMCRTVHADVCAAVCAH